MANKQIIILDVTANSIGDSFVRYVMWFYPPVANQVPLPNATSQWRGASASDLTNLQSGAVVEQANSITFPQTMSVAEMKAYLVQVYNTRQSQITAAPNPNQFYGAFYDGTAWTGV